MAEGHHSGDLAVVLLRERRRELQTVFGIEENGVGAGIGGGQHSLERVSLGRRVEVQLLGQVSTRLPVKRPEMAAFPPHSKRSTPGQRQLNVSKAMATWHLLMN